jgi:two-component system, chemotaxis family, sensor kinase Cph1
MQQIIEFFSGLFATDQWPARWHCGNWSSFHGWLYILSDLTIWIAYFLIPVIILNYLSKKKNGIKFQKVYLLFAAFILFCGMTHFLDAVMFWIPVYRLNALVRLITATVSMLTVYYLIKILPQVFRLKSTEELEKEVMRRIQAEEKLAEANASLTSFAYIASHDLQEPVRKIKFFASQLGEHYYGKLDSAGNELVEKILKSGTRMQTMTTDILKLSGYTDQIAMGLVNLRNAIDISLQDLDNRIRETGAQIKIGPLPDVYGNLSYLAHLFLNLLSNSLKFSKETPVIKIWGESSGNSANIYVEDNGIGIPDDGQQKIFYAFQRMHGKSEYEGSGLGLAICKRIMDVHGGSISVHSLLNEGSTFVVTLPTVKPEEKDIR